MGAAGRFAMVSVRDVRWRVSRMDSLLCPYFLCGRGDDLYGVYTASQGEWFKRIETGEPATARPISHTVAFGMLRPRGLNVHIQNRFHHKASSSYKDCAARNEGPKWPNLCRSYPFLPVAITSPNPT
jgi:hypothetical protein